MRQISDEKLGSLMEIVKELNSANDLESTLNLIMTKAKKMARAEASSLMLIDQETRELYFNVATGGAEDILKQIRIPSGIGFAGIVAASGKGLIANDASHDPRFYKGVDARTQFATRNLVCVPLQVRGRTIGVLQVLNKMDSRDFSEEDMNFLKVFSDFAAIAIHNRELYNDMQRKAHEAAALHRLCETINFCETFEDLIREDATIVGEVMEAKRVSVILKSGDKYRIIYRTGFPEAAKFDRVKAGSVLNLMLRTNEGVFSPNVEHDDRFENVHPGRYRDKSFVAAPLKLKNQIVAFICVTERYRRQPYEYSDLRTLEMMCQQIMENYNHFKLSEEYKKKQLIEAELSITARLQQDILPKVFPCEECLEIAAMSVPAKIVGGDFYDYIPFGNGQYGLVMADVSGKGVSAGLFMALSRSFIRAHFKAVSSPAAMMEIVNRHICHDSKTSMFVTCFCCVIDAASREITYSNAGHLEQYLVNRESGELRALYTPGRPIGIFEDSRYIEHTVNYAAGDFLFLYTDGITEAANGSFEEFGGTKLRQCLLEEDTARSEEILKSVFDGISAFRGEAEQSDDITMLAVRFI